VLSLAHALRHGLLVDDAQLVMLSSPVLPGNLIPQLMPLNEFWENLQKKRLAEGKTLGVDS